MEKDLTLCKAVEIAKLAAEGTKWASQFDIGSHEVNFVNKKFKPYSKFVPNKSKNNTQSKSCLRCGSNKHLAN